MTPTPIPPATAQLISRLLLAGHSTERVGKALGVATTSARSYIRYARQMLGDTAVPVRRGGRRPLWAKGADFIR